MSTFKGLSGSWLSSNTTIAKTAVCSVHAGDQQSGFKMSKQISPVLKSTLQCGICLQMGSLAPVPAPAGLSTSNRICGGSNGYAGGTQMSNLK